MTKTSDSMFQVYQNYSDLYDELVNHEDFDKIIEGWSFGHLVVQDDENRNQTIQTLISETKKRAKKVIFIETLGTNVEVPSKVAQLERNVTHH